MWFISILHMGTNVYVVEVQFSSEQKMLVEGLGPALTQTRKDVYCTGDWENESRFLPRHLKMPWLGNTNIFLFQFPFSFCLLHLVGHCWLLLLGTMLYTLINKSKPSLAVSLGTRTPMLGEVQASREPGAESLCCVLPWNQVVSS